MSWTYDPETLATDPLMKVRLLIQDTNEEDQQLQDEEIQYFLTTESDLKMAAGRCAESLAARYSRKADSKKMGDLAITWAKTADRYTALADRLMARSFAVPTAGGIEVSDRNSNQADQSVTHSTIRRGMHDFTTPPVLPNTQ